MVAVCHWCQLIRDMTCARIHSALYSCGMMNKYSIDVVTGSQKQVACGVDSSVSRAEEKVAGVGVMAF